ncbi:hypothetical protein AMATHDRAFT_49999 [Amanita thiersii Skay4041]|uniref:Uncharacterized protein n=1 Tax=Amanita thiersii Skay4041 TaxID=703135 RepID=A0A2A9NCM4_9AGAR|nr:hypothetical protein AMATHDRAFT_49999 [Amanita thiersii Skay4041]
MEELSFAVVTLALKSQPMYLRTRYLLTAALARRPSIQACQLNTTSVSCYPTSQKHSTDAYNKDDTDTSPPDDTHLFQVDPTADIQTPTTPLSGEWSHAGVKTAEYEHVDKQSQPYAAPGQSQRYGNIDVWAKDKGPEMSHPGQGPEGTAAGGRKPEGR